MAIRWNFHVFPVLRPKFLWLIDGNVYRGTYAVEQWTKGQLSIYLLSMIAMAWHTAWKQQSKIIFYSNIPWWKSNLHSCWLLSTKKNSNNQIVKRPESMWNCFNANTKQLLLLFTISFIQIPAHSRIWTAWCSVLMCSAHASIYLSLSSSTFHFFFFHYFLSLLESILSLSRRALSHTIEICMRIKAWRLLNMLIHVWGCTQENHSTFNTFASFLPLYRIEM